jgi:hypothetical protein
MAIGKYKNSRSITLKISDIDLLTLRKIMPNINIISDLLPSHGLPSDADMRERINNIWTKLNKLRLLSAEHIPNPRPVNHKFTKASGINVTGSIYGRNDFTSLLSRLSSRNKYNLKFVSKPSVVADTSGFVTIDPNQVKIDFK